MPGMQDFSPPPRPLSLTHGTPWPHQESEPPPDFSEQIPCTFLIIWAVYTTAISACAGAAGRVSNPGSRTVFFFTQVTADLSSEKSPKDAKAKLQSQNSDHLLRPHGPAADPTNPNLTDADSPDQVSHSSTSGSDPSSGHQPHEATKNHRLTTGFSGRLTSHTPAQPCMLSDALRRE